MMILAPPWLPVTVNRDSSLQMTLDHCSTIQLACLWAQRSLLFMCPFVHRWLMSRNIRTILYPFQTAVNSLLPTFTSTLRNSNLRPSYVTNGSSPMVLISSPLDLSLILWVLHFGLAGRGDPVFFILSTVL